MAELTYTVTVASGNLYGGGTGNVFYLDGVRNSTGPGTVNWVNGGTLRFEQSDASNNNHPLVFSTNTSTSGIISSGITYYLDGASNQSNYTNTTTFNAATTRYIEVTTSSETDFYYLCYVHGIGMGGIFDITQNTWGALGWGQGGWATQNNVGLPLTGQSLTSSIGTATIDESILTGEGWGREQWGSFAWGVTYSVALTGQTLTSSIGEETGFTDITVSVTGSSLTSTLGLISLVGDFGTVVNAAENQLNFTVGSAFSLQADANVSLSGISLSGSIGQVVLEPKFIADVTGIQSTLSLGTIALEQTTIESVTGQTITMSIGEEEQANVYPVTGSTMTGSIGSVTVTGEAGIDVSGIQLTASVGPLNITAWAEVNPGVNNVWTVVDRAA